MNMSVSPLEFACEDGAFIKTLIDKVVTDNIFSDNRNVISVELERVPDVALMVGDIPVEFILPLFMHLFVVETVMLCMNLAPKPS